MANQQVILVITLILASGYLFTHGVLQMNTRTRERAIERALGLKKGQIMRLILLEEIIIIFSALIAGAIVGTLFAAVYIHAGAFLANTGYVLRPDVVFPTVSFLQYVFWFAVIMIVAAIPSVIIQQKYETGSLLKQYE